MTEYLNVNRLEPSHTYGITYNGAKVPPSTGTFVEKLENGRVKFEDFVDPTGGVRGVEEIVLKPYGLRFFDAGGYQTGGRRRTRGRRSTRRRARHSRRRV